MTRKLFAVTILIVILFSACMPATSTPTSTITPSDTPTPTATATYTSTATPTQTATNTPMATATPIQYEKGKFITSNSGTYYFDPSLKKSTGTLEGEFYICLRYLNWDRRYDSFLIAKTNIDCINRDILGWVETGKVVLGDGNYDGETVSLLPGTKQCNDLIDNDQDGFIDLSDSGCENVDDDLENTEIVHQVQENPNEIVQIALPRRGTSVECANEFCPVQVTVNWENHTAGTRICVFVQSQENNGQPFFYHFEGTTGTLYIGGPKNTEFKIIAVSTSSSCSGGPNLPQGKSGNVSVTRR